MIKGYNTGSAASKAVKHSGATASKAVKKSSQSAKAAASKTKRAAKQNLMMPVNVQQNIKNPMNKLNVPFPTPVRMK